MCEDNGWISSGPNSEFQAGLERGKSEHRLRPLGLQQVLRHVEHEQRLHPVIGEALPHFCGEQEGQPARMTEQFSVLLRRHGHLSRQRREVTWGAVEAQPNRLPWPGSLAPLLRRRRRIVNGGLTGVGVLPCAVAPTRPSENSISSGAPGCTAAAVRSGWPAPSRTSAKPRDRTPR